MSTPKIKKEIRVRFLDLDATRRRLRGLAAACSEAASSRDGRVVMLGIELVKMQGQTLGAEAQR